MAPYFLLHQLSPAHCNTTMQAMSFILHLLVTTRAATLHPALPPCGSYSDCNSLAYNFLPLVTSMSTCQEICQTDPQCSHYSYNYSHHSILHRHCFLYTQCTVGEEEYEGWVTAPMECLEELVNPVLMTAIRTSYFRAS